MKYIRTNDMVATSEDYDEYFNAVEIINQADTIKELCDEFVAVIGLIHINDYIY